MIERDYVLKFLQNKQEIEGGYTGNDLTELAELLRVTSRGVRKRISNWIKNDKEHQGYGKDTDSKNQIHLGL